MSRNIKSDINNVQTYNVVAFYARMSYWRCCIIQDKFWNTYTNLAKCFGIRIISNFAYKVRI
jgi:hypothetical protein